MDKQSTTSQANPPEPVNCGSRKPLKDWTLGEVQEQCYMHRVKLDFGRHGFCEESDCEIRKRGICQKEWVHDWNLEPAPRFAEKEVADARVLYKMFGNDAMIAKADDSATFLLADCKQINIRDVFPSILPGTSVKLSEIIEKK